MSARQPLLDPTASSPSRGSAKGTVGGAGGGYADSKHGEGSYQGLDSGYQQAFDSLRRDLRRLENITSSAHKALEVVGTAREGPKTRGDVAKLVADGGSLISVLTKDIKTISAMPVDRAERVNRQMQVQKVKQDFAQRVEAFQKVAKAAESREREAARDDHRRASSAVDPDDEEDPAADRLRAMNIQQVNFNESIVEERLEAFQDIQRNVGLVNEAFRDLAVLVADQQEDIDNIEVNISEGHKKTADGVVQLQEAQKHQKKARGKIIGLLIVVVVIAVIVGVIVYLKVK